jgi:hypothetical protein
MMTATATAQVLEHMHGRVPIDLTGKPDPEVN